ncbi:unannotated protein [freshwater metagenome]|uniref:Unannotated protein n=1 Tax=freshwater metagenome TaxID=449393 RepID=A0A6J7DND0_9ZZZZ
MKGEGKLQKLAGLILTRSKYVISLWLLLLLATSLISSRVGSSLTDSLVLPKSESQTAADLLDSQPSLHSKGSLVVVFSSTSDNPLKAVDIKLLISAITRLPFVESMTSPFTQDSTSISRDRKFAFSTVKLNVSNLGNREERIKKVIEKSQQKKRSSMQVELLMGDDQSSGSTSSHTSELIALLASLIILLLTFRSLPAAMMPIIIAVTALLIASNLIGMVSHIFSIASFAPILSTLIGLGVGIDYALFIVSRFRQSLHQSHTVEESILTALKTSGRAVVFAGLIVCISILGLFSVGIEFLYGVAIATSISVLVTMCASVTLLPALLVLIGPRIDLFSIPRFSRQGSKRQPEVSRWQSWALLIQRHPVKWALASAIILIFLFIPASHMRLGTADAGNNPADSTSRKAYDLMAQGFGPGFAGPLTLVATIPDGADPRVLDQLSIDLSQDLDVAQVLPVEFFSDSRLAVITVYPKSAPQDPATDALISRLRAHVIPTTVGSSDIQVYVGGVAASFFDIGVVLTDKLPAFVLSVLLLSFLLLMIVFRSLLIPLKAVIMNVLAIGAAFGVVVVTFQWGWGQGLLGNKGGPIESYLPLTLFAILFGLSMDYEIFLVTRIQEEWQRTGDNSHAVRKGLSETGGVITSAAAIMFSVFLTFAFGQERVIKEFGIGLATAVAIDATLIRMILVPALMQIWGKANWWLPKGVARLLPKVKI